MNVDENAKFMGVLGKENRPDNFPDFMMMAKGSHRFAKFKLNAEMTAQTAVRRDEARLMSWMDEETGGHFRYISCEDIESQVIKRSKLTIVYFGDFRNLKKAGRHGYLTEIMAIDNAVNAKEDRIPDWRYNHSPDCHKARSLEKPSLVLYAMENTKPFIYTFPDDFENRKEAIF